MGSALGGAGIVVPALAQETLELAGDRVARGQRSGVVARLVSGFRGAQPADLTALESLLHRLSQLADDVPELAELDLNPVIALPDRAVVVDARIRLARPEPAAGPKTW